LPHFDSPPVIETAMGIEFAPLPALGFLNLTKLQSVWADRFPNVSEQPALPSTIDLSAGPRLQLLQGAPGVRAWAESMPGTNGLLVQTQSDRLVLNWRKAFSADGRYPGYASLRASFKQVWGELVDFVAANSLGVLAPTSAEYTYVNHVNLDANEFIEDALTIMTRPESELPGVPASAQFQVIRMVQESPSDPFTAQVQITGAPQAIDGHTVLAMNVTTKALFATGGDPLAALDAAHALSSHTFFNITTDEKHRDWGTNESAN
jgi:uncharacterized protein (TIGR04255 family)